MAKIKVSDAEMVEGFMRDLQHPLQAEMEEVRKIISRNPLISERIKWKAPSYYYKEDLVTFNPRDKTRIHLVFHHPNIVKIDSALLEGDYKDRRMTYFNNMVEVQKHKEELTRIINELVNMLEG